MQKLSLSLLLIVFAFTSVAQNLTYYKDVEPIIQTKCSGCHKPGESTPFSLLTYDDVAKRASFIKDVVQSKYMPPWKADNKYVHFINDRSLSQKQIDMIVNWVDDKAPAGTKPANDTLESATLLNTSYKRKPDLVLTMKDSFLVKGDGLERFVVFKIPFELKDTANVEAIEFFSNNEKL